MQVSVIKHGGKYLGFNNSYCWVNELASAYLYFGSSRVVGDFHSYMMSRDDDSVYRDFMQVSKARQVQVVELILEEKSV